MADVIPEPGQIYLLEFTFDSTSNGKVTVNGDEVTSPYTLQNGDIIRIYTRNGDTAGMYLNGETLYSQGFQSGEPKTISLSDQNIEYTESGFGKGGVGDDEPTIIINYTEGGSTVTKSYDLSTSSK